ncbi:MAD2L1-binding protein [Bombina bombina]|uniref:MAD2L1-binding protein n=1 Tax=Bombina bombina TaxID=8345 RepID=UPI00235B1655|nr:MAD2L1-binding protein [Bombina bombina]
MEQKVSEEPPRRTRGTNLAQHRRCSQDGRVVSVVFPGLVTRDSCCLFTCELLKHILHQRHQLPLPYEQLVSFSRKQQVSEDAGRRHPKAEDLDARRCQRTISELEELLHELEILFTLTQVPRVLLLLGGNPLNPKELYEINMEGVQVGNGDQSLRTRPCLRQLFHSIFVADPFSDLQSSPLMCLVLMVQAHRDCGTNWFRPKLNYKVPSRGHTLAVKLSCGEAETVDQKKDDYIWFQAPITIKGFQN